MTEGTKSYLIGCHQFLLHPLWVLMAWRLEYKAWPKWWQLICILFHDIGICGRQYMSDDTAKKGHWELGANISGDLVDALSNRSSYYPNGHIAYLFCAGHAPKESGYRQSALFIPDKRSFLVAPMWWKWWNYWVEGFKTTNPIEWTKLVEENLKKDEPMASHELYLHNLYNHTQKENERERLNDKNNT